MEDTINKDHMARERVVMQPDSAEVIFYWFVIDLENG